VAVSCDVNDNKLNECRKEFLMEQLKRTSTSLTSSTSKRRKGDEVEEELTQPRKAVSTVDEEEKMARLAPLVFLNDVVSKNNCNSRLASQSIRFNGKC